MGEWLHDRWEIYKILKGGMGIVYIVYDQELHEPFAVKTFQDDVFSRIPDMAERFTREAFTWINLDSHPNVVQALYDCTTYKASPTFSLSMSAAATESVGGHAAADQKLTSDSLPFQFCDGMNYAISKGLRVHRDIKPQNCLVTQDNVLKITDFGLMKVFDDIQRRTGRTS